MNDLPNTSRRNFLYGLGASLGTAAFNALLQADDHNPKSQIRNPKSTGPLTPRPQHHPAKAKACIMLYMAGGPSHIDLFEPKPELEKRHMQEFVRKDKFQSAMASGKRYFIKSPYKFQRAGKSGLWMCDEWKHLPKVADELCYYHGCQAESINHPTANYHMNTGSQFGGEPAIGSWVTYGLGTENQDLPAFVVLPEVNFPQGGAANWSNGYLPSYFQGTTLRPKGSPILDLQPPPGVTKDVQRANLDLLATLDQKHRQQHPHHDALAAPMEGYELACSMQANVPDIIDVKQEDQRTLEMYGVGDAVTDQFARQCLLARRLVEKGVRFVQIYCGGWDSHDYLERSHRSRIQVTDQPIAALISDLRQRGMLDETLVFWTGEFGRSPDNGMRGGKKVGRDHNAKGMAMWLAGGGVRAGHAIGATDEIGEAAVDIAHPIKDMHVTLLHLLGLDDNNLTYFHAGRFKQLSQVGGSVIKELIA